MGGSASSGRHTTSPWARASVSKKAGTVALPLTALWLDIGFSLFFVFYAFGYTWPMTTSSLYRTKPADGPYD